MPLDLIRDVKRTVAGRTFVVPVAQVIVPDRPYTAAELGTLLGGGRWTARKVASVITVLGRPESRHGARIFQRPADGHTPSLRPCGMPSSLPKSGGRRQHRQDASRRNRAEPKGSSRAHGNPR